MRHRIAAYLRRHAIAYVALFVALSGTSYALADQGAPVAGDGGGNVAARARTTSEVRATHGTSTGVPLDGSSWAQSAGELELLAGTMQVTTPAACTGGFGNELVLSVDGQPTTFAVAVSAPGAGSTTVTIPFAVGTLREPDRDTPHELTAKFINTCSRDGEDFTVKDVQVDVLMFR
jgi:hypothetical protein